MTSHASGTVLHLALPLADRADVDLARNGDDLVVTVGSYRRLLTVPSGLSRHRVAGARVEDGELQVRFVEEHSERARGDMTDATADEPVGSAAEEAAKLLGAVSEWAREHGSDVGTAFGGLADQVVGRRARRRRAPRDRRGLQVLPAVPGRPGLPVRVAGGP